MEEIWKPIEGYEEFYEVSNLGRIKCLERYVPIPNPKFGTVGYRTYPERIKPCVINKQGYRQVTLSKNAKSHTLRVHRLVALAFIPNPLNKPYINHIDGNKTNNCVDNLEWCTASENNWHASLVLGIDRSHCPDVAHEANKIPVMRDDGVIYPSMQALMREIGLKGSTRAFMRDGSTYRGHTYKILKEKRGFASEETEPVSDR